MSVGVFIFTELIAYKETKLGGTNVDSPDWPYLIRSRKLSRDGPG